MMRKLLVLILVLGITSAANAVLIQVNGEVADSHIVAVDAVATIDVVGEDTANYLGYIIVAEGGVGALAGGAGTEIIGDPQLAGISPYTEAGWGAGYELTVAGTASFPVSEGTHFTMTFSSAQEGTASVQLFLDPDYEVPAAATEILVPEPITVALLGLGGLFIRRRK